MVRHLLKDLDFMGQREEVARAFVAKYGMEPDEVVQVVEATSTGFKWYLKKREGEVKKKKGSK
jgi:predicted secreted protein